jgi:hypothetical protein
MIRRFGAAGTSGRANATQTAPDGRKGVQPSSFDNILLRTVGWGTAAALALGAAVFTAQTETGTERIQLAFAGTVLPQPAVATAKTSDPAIATLQTQLERLAADRGRQEARLASLEHELEDVTGSIRNQTDKRETPPHIARIAPTPTAPPVIEPPAIPAMETLSLIPKATTPPAAEEPAPTKVPETAAAPSAEPTEAAPATETQTEVPLPPNRVAALPARPQRAAEYGIELGNSADLASLQSRWLSIKANFGPLLVGLSPVAVKDKHPGSKTVRLMAGPMRSMAAARELCAKFAAQNGYCFPRQVDAADIVQR